MTESAGEGQMSGMQQVDAGVVRIGSGGVVDIDTGNGPDGTHLLDDLSSHGVLGRVAAGPDAVEVRLAIQKAKILLRRPNVA
ncbi:MAG: hypothetical protein GTO59_16460, partial [Gammaproteobacteria bacterium]|nr:hypothetical protein [Gammaproteobacteria bacterium]